MYEVLIFQTHFLTFILTLCSLLYLYVRTVIRDYSRTRTLKGVLMHWAQINGQSPKLMLTDRARL